MKLLAFLLAIAACDGNDVVDDLVEPDPVGIIVSSTDVVLTEGAEVVIEVSLDHPPADGLTIAVAAMGAASASPTSLTFTHGNFDESQMITIAAPRDSDLADAVGSVELTGADTSASIAVAIRDADLQQIITTQSTLNVTEGQSGTFVVSLAFAPTASTTVVVTSQDPSVAAVTPSALSFTPANFAAPQSVTVTAADDMNLATDTTQIRLSATDVATTDVSINVLDNDQQRIVLESTTVSVPEAGSRGVGVSLAYAPAMPVTVTVSSDNPQVLPAHPATLTFYPTDYATPRQVTFYSGKDRNAIEETATATLLEPLSNATATIFATIDDTVAREAYGWPTSFFTYTQIESGPVLAFQITVLQAGTFDTIGLISSSGSGNFRMVLYTDNAGAPGTLVADTDTGRAQIYVGDTPIIQNPTPLSAGTYWIALRIEGPALINESDGAVTARTCVRAIEIPDLDLAWPSSFGAASCQTGAAYNVYIDTLL